MERNTRPLTLAIPEANPDTFAEVATRLHDRAGTIDLTDQQISYLLGELRQDRVRVHQGNSYLEGWDVRRTLTRIFGFGGWELTTTELKCIREHSVPSGTDGKKFRWWATYRAQVRLAVYTRDGRKIAHFEDGSAGESSNQPSHGDCHDMAMKTALTGALKRCAVNLGDQLGLSLYRNGGTDPVVLGGLPYIKDESPEVAEGPGVAEEQTDMSEVGGPQPEPEPEPAPAPPPAPAETPAAPAPDENPEEWAEKFAAALPGADLGKLAAMQNDLSNRLKAKWVPVPVARKLMTDLNRRRGEAKKAAGVPVTPRDLRLALILAKVVGKQIKQADDLHRRELVEDEEGTDPDDAMTLGERRAVHVRGADGSRVLVGHVRVDSAPVTARVVDEEAFTEWVSTVAPDEVVVSVRVRDSFTNSVLTQLKRDGKAVDPSTGELVDVPGTELELGDPKVVAYPEKNALEVLSEAFGRGRCLSGRGS
ncbi:hypothetical protein KGD82_16695 [Nocardiopsis eucommiae]|uniref:Uncharacterized protein n=1 Tax=Nocardiopsis eucommiae TaxID=2831970 RepID=A0A975L7L4_9ACTN|nr:hypothetical protein KGD82_16695 [Nocardiopsis eucommiae]